MITLGTYGYKKNQKRRETKKFNEHIGTAPPVVDQSAEFVQSPSSALPSTSPLVGAVGHAQSSSSRHGETTSKPSSAVELSSAVTKSSSESAPSTTLSTTSSDSRAYQHYGERQSSQCSEETPDQPPTYQDALGSPPGRTAGTWIFIPAGGQVPFANGLPASPLPASPPFASLPAANELSARLPPAAYARPAMNELPADAPISVERNAAGTAPVFELAAGDDSTPSSVSRQSEKGDESRPSGETKWNELA